MLPGSVEYAVAAVVAAGAYLPAGKGAVILIMGGLVMVLLSIVAAVFGRRRRIPTGATAYAPPLHPRASAAVSNNGWVGPVLGVIVDAGMGRPVVTAADADHLGIVLKECRSCRTGRRGGLGCEPERRMIEAAVARTGRSATVSELSCNPRGQGECTFEVRRQDRP